MGNSGAGWYRPDRFQGRTANNLSATVRQLLDNSSCSAFIGLCRGRGHRKHGEIRFGAPYRHEQFSAQVHCQRPISQRSALGPFWGINPKRSNLQTESRSC